KACCADACTSRSRRRTARRSTRSTPPRSRPAASTTARRACARTTTRTTTQRSCSTRTATTSRPAPICPGRATAVLPRITRMNKDRALVESGLTERVLGVFYSVYNELGVGFLESVYENALVLVLREAGLDVEQQTALPVNFHGQAIGEFRADIVVEK